LHPLDRCTYDPSFYSPNIYINFPQVNGFFNTKSRRLCCECTQLFNNCFPDFGIHLAEFTVDSAGPLPVRQLASVLLKQYVETHWCNYSSTFQPPETTEHAKVTIKELLPFGLKESVSKVL
jgi:hypothetical protein